MTERLEEIKSRVWKDKCTYAMGDYRNREGYTYTLSDYDYDWLIEQAERAQELEEDNVILKATRAGNEEHIDMLHKQNKRYREALEQIANSDGWLIEPNPLCTVEEAYGRCVDVAERALEL